MMRILVVVALCMTYLMEGAQFLDGFAAAQWFFGCVAVMVWAAPRRDRVRLITWYIAGRPARNDAEAARLGRLHQLAADTALLVGILFTTMAMIQSLASLALGGLVGLIDDAVRAQTALLAGVAIRIALEAIGPPTSVQSSDDDPVPQKRGLSRVIAICVGMAVVYSFDLGPEPYINVPAILLVIIVPGLIARSRLVVFERAQLAFGYAGIIIGTLQVVSQMATDHVDMADLGMGVAIVFVAAFYMSAGSLIARIKAFGQPEGLSGFQSAWRHAFSSILLIGMIILIGFALVKSKNAPAPVNYSMGREYFDAGEFSVALEDNSGRKSNLSTHILLQVRQQRPDFEATMRELNDRKPELTDTILEGLLTTDPVAIQGTPEGRKKGFAEMKAMIFRRVNGSVRNKIDGVLIQELSLDFSDTGRTK